MKIKRIKFQNYTVFEDGLQFVGPFCYTQYCHSISIFLKD